MKATRLEQEIHIERPTPEVFSAWATAAALADWFAPMAVEKPDVKLDFREGGKYSIRMLLPGDQVFTTAGKFEQIDMNRKIVMTWRCDAFPDRATRVTVVFTPDQTGTTVRVTHERFEFPETCANHTQGWQLCLAELKDLLER